MNSQRFVNYYLSQSGSGSLPGFVGAPVMYGRGLGSMLSRAFRFVLPFIKRGVNIAKPHLKSAAKGIASDVVGAVTTHIANRGSHQQEAQEGSGLSRLARRRKRSTGVSAHSILKKPRKKDSKRQRKFKTQLGGGDIF